ncbi:MAG: tRNA uridine-5-carboxymethylaminomethyl(34) synthesis GTPase MnmE [Burkholderiales bacterium]|jgi:tRNA modification GTPase|nr:tRNA uridine-5-carboxymethylaminomethyl(34) synthesis GTPase MnmE [Burkholderiales bacterium]
MLPRHQDPIAAIATAPGRGAVGIVRLSGRSLQPLAQALTGRSLKPRHAHYGPLLAADAGAIDHGLALYFPAPHSYTGEDVLELQAHGGPIVLQLLLARCLEAAAQPGPDGPPLLPHLRLAEPGEFTERAFLNHKLDLAQAEAVADLIDASTEAAARSAARSLSGEFSRHIGELREQMINLRMLVEATLDFPEEEIDFLERADARGRLQRLAAQLDRVLDSARQGALLRDGLRVVLAGQPNAGKSSLLNALAGAELAIVTPIPGTTRDRIGETLQIEGVPVHVTDTAGLREDHAAVDEVERIGISRSWEAIAQADAVLLLHDLTRAENAEYRAADAAIEAQLPAAAHIVHVHNKADAAPAAAQRLAEGPDGTGNGTCDQVILSARTHDGLDRLRRRLLELAGWHAAPEGVCIARERHVQALRRARGHLDEARQRAELGDAALELLAEELRLAHDALGEITGACTPDDLLGVIFGRFCIGK